MSHGIMDIDRGIVAADTTWHRLPQYECLGEGNWVDPHRARAIAEYPLEKRQPMRVDNNGDYVPAEAWEIVRTDCGFPVVPNVGSRFEAVSNTHLFDAVDNNVLRIYPELKIDSVGTLFGGATYFLSLRLEEIKVKGDDSPILSHMQFVNPLGRGSYLAFCSTTRIVCNNTQRVAETQGALNQTLKKFRHTASAMDRINEHAEWMAEVRMGLRQLGYHLARLADTELTTTRLSEFLDEFFPVPEEEGRAQTMATTRRENYLAVFSSQKAMQPALVNSSYGLYQAFTDYIDHQTISRNSDQAAVDWDGLTGIRASEKEKVFQYLLKNV